MRDPLTLLDEHQVESFRRAIRASRDAALAMRGVPRHSGVDFVLVHVGFAVTCSSSVEDDLIHLARLSSAATRMASERVLGAGMVAHFALGHLLLTQWALAVDGELLDQAREQFVLCVAVAREHAALEHTVH